MVRNNSLGNQPSHGARSPSNSRKSIAIGAALSLLLHALGFWFLIAHPPSEVQTPPSGEEGRLTVSLAAPPAAPSAQPVAPAPAIPKPDKPAKPAARRPPAKKPVPDIDREPPKLAEAPPVPPTTTSAQEEAQARIAPSDDMFTHLQAARKRRAEARAQAGLPEQDASAPAEAANDNRIALANIASSMQRARRDDPAASGGMFQLRRMGYRDAQVFFRGWSANANRDRTRLISVEQGAEADLQTAVVKKMIDVIREERQGDFTWESRRLGKLLTLSARPQDDAALQRFLMQEFFPDYTPAAAGR